MAPGFKFQVPGLNLELGTWNLELFFPLRLPLLDVLGRLGAKLVSAAGATDVVGLAFVADGDCPFPAADNALA